jgi:choline kinase
MKAIILATRKGTRLLPLTKEIPQCMLKIKDKTILELQIENLKNVGIQDIIVLTGHLSEKVEKLSQMLGIKTLFNPFHNVSWMALALWLVKQELDDDFIFIYSDVLFDKEVIKELLKNEKDICLSIKKNRLRAEAEKVIEEQGIIKRISKDIINGENGEYIGIAKFTNLGSKILIKELDDIAKINLNASFIEVIDSLIKKGEVIFAHNIEDAQFVDIDFPEDLEKAKKIFG